MYHVETSLNFFDFLYRQLWQSRLVFVYVPEKRKLCSRKSRFSSNIQLGILPIIKFRSGWWWSKCHYIWSIWGITRGGERFFGSDLYPLNDAAKCGFCLNTGKRFLVEVSFLSQWKTLMFHSKMVLETFKMALRLRDRYAFMWQLPGILNVFDTLTLKQVFWKTKTFLKKLE